MPFGLGMLVEESATSSLVSGFFAVTNSTTVHRGELGLEFHVIRLPLQPPCCKLEAAARCDMKAGRGRCLWFMSVRTPPSPVKASVTAQTLAGLISCHIAKCGQATDRRGDECNPSSGSSRFALAPSWQRGFRRAGRPHADFPYSCERRDSGRMCEISYCAVERFRKFIPRCGTTATGPEHEIVWWEAKS